MQMNREYSLDFFRQHIFSEDYIIITSNSENTRSQKLLLEFPDAKYIDIIYSVSPNKSGALDDSFMVTTSFKCTFNGNCYCSLYQDLQSFVSQINNESKKLIIDISGFHLRFLGAFLAIISDNEWDSVICAYTEPTAYPRTEDVTPVGISDGEKGKFSGGFDLNSSFWGYDEIPNLKTITSERGNYIWIAFLGFEGKRSSAVYTEISDDSSTTIPVITIPAIRPGWANYAFEANQVLFENAKISSADIKYTDALDPYAAYNFIESISSKYPKRHLVISPLGTRPVSLGVLLYALKHEESEIYFVTPKESCSKIVSSGKIHIYDMLSFFNS